MKTTLARAAMIMLAVMIAFSSLGVAVAQETSEELQTNTRVLSIRMPGVVQAGDEVKIGVTERISGKPIEGASVYALSWPVNVAVDIASVYSLTDASSIPHYNCEFLGKTNSDGVVVNTFERPGRFLIVATKDGFGPGLALLTVKPALKQLAIKAPAKAEVHQPVTITVFERNNEVPVPGADLWAVRLPVTDADSASNPPEIDVQSLMDRITEASDEDATDLLRKYAIYLGQTGNNGELEYTFQRTGSYLLVALKSGYVPGFKQITIVPNKALVIEAPRQAEVHQPVTIKVFERNNEVPVPGADLWAVRLPVTDADSASNPPEIDVQSLTDRITEASDEDATDLLRKYAIYLGQTGDDGELDYAFQQTGRYLLIAVKSGYIPGFKQITIVPQKALAIKAPRQAEVGHPVTIKVYEKNSGGAVSEADLWAIKLSPTGSDRDGDSQDIDVRALMDEIIGDVDGDIAGLLSRYEYYYLGQTNNAGELDYAFQDTGRYLLIAIKSDYVPGFRFITIVPQKELIIRSPEVASVNEVVTFTVVTQGQNFVLERSSINELALMGVGINSAAPYAVKMPFNISAARMVLAEPHVQAPVVQATPELASPVVRDISYPVEGVDL
ncbi:MAG: hypothetical protein SVO26_06740, partial [Chloroflexota bacterium]|nr:hypothetical protein [Chloroflexota bacterium]